MFDLLGPSVFDFLKKNSFTPFTLSHIQALGKQLIDSVACEKSLYQPWLFNCLWSEIDLTSVSVTVDLHRLGLVHTDLKPENILLADSSLHTFLDDVRLF